MNMTSYILLLVIILLVLVGVWRASRQEKRQQRRQREPSLGILQSATQDESGVEEEYWPKPVTKPRQSADIAQTVAATPAEKLAEQLEMAEPAAVTTAELESPGVGEEFGLIEFVVIHLFTDGDRPYRGYELLQALLTGGLRYGKKGIFHRHEDLTGKGSVLFSMAQALEPGTFDLPKMGSFTTPGLIFFMVSSELHNPLAAFDLMLKTVKNLQKELGGSLYDEHKQALTAEKIEQLRSNLKMFSRDD